MTEQPLTLGTAILELIELYHDDHLEYYKVVVTICAIFGKDPARPLDDKQLLRLEEVRATVPARNIHPFQRKEKKEYVTAESPTAR
jgi:hypothetical protein